MREPTCQFLDNILPSMQAGQKTLLHRDAGRDRTGTISALLAAMAAKAKGALNGEMLNAIECDYRKTELLVPEKYGHIERFICKINEQGSVATFLQNQCGIPKTTTLQAARKFALE